MDFSAVKSDPVSRNRFLEKYKAYVHKVASAHCRRTLEWGRDEELSIAFIALDSALDIYQPQRGASFESFAAMIIKRRLIDYQRAARRRARREVAVEEMPRTRAAPVYGEEFLRLERAAELKEFAGLLAQYDITFADLARESPRQQGVRERLLRAARAVVARPGMHARIVDTGRLPLQELADLTGETRKVLANRRRYFLALLLVADRAEDFPFLATYLGLGRDEG